jgi:predicted ester cyclase
MTRAEVAALFERREAAWRAADAAALAGTHTPDGVVISPTGGVLEGRDEIERVYRIWLDAFKGISFVPDDLLIDGDRVAQIARLRGTHSGEFFGVAATGRSIEVTVALVMTLVDGFVAEERRIYDFTGLLVQIGVLRAKPSA